MINRFFFLFSALVFLIGNTSSGMTSDSFTTHTQLTPELKPASFDNFNPEGSYKVASVCFLGIGCGDDGKFGKGDDYELDTKQQCKNEGYTITSCTSPEVPFGQCPYNDGYFKECKNINGEKCQNEGYAQNCPEGNVLDDAQNCPYDVSHKKCKCNPCEGYDYTYAEATSEGYILGASCNSCGTMKYQRQNAPCNGFLSCECGGEIGASTCKSGTNTLFTQCKECIKCNDDCPDGYYKTVGKYGSCNFGSDTTTTECGTTCYKCKKANTRINSCLMYCPEGYTSNEYHDYECNPLTCRNKIKAKYPNYFYGSNLDRNCRSDDYKDTYQFDRSYVGESSHYRFLGDWCYLTPKIITNSFFVEADFATEFPECKNYCYPTGEVISRTFKGDIYLGIGAYFSSYEGYKGFYDITIDGSLTLAGGTSKDFEKLRLEKNAVLKCETRDNDGSLGAPASLKDVFLNQGATIESIGGKSTLYDTTIAGNTADSAVTIINFAVNGNITSAHILAGTSGGIYVNFNNIYDSSWKDYSIIRNPVGEINITVEPGRNGNSPTLFKNPGVDTTVTLIKATTTFFSFYSACITLANDENKKLCSDKRGNAIITFLTDDYIKHVLPTCCSQDSDCPESSWNTGTVKCEGYSKQ